MTKRSEATLWGMEGLFAGNEQRIHACMPMFQVAGHEAIYVARKADWALETGDGLTAIEEVQAAEAGERLELDKPCPVEPGEIVAVVGPAYCEAIERGAPKLAAIVYDERWWPVQAGFQIALLTPDAYDRLRGQLHDEAKAAFDREVRATWRGGLSDRARAALDVLRHTAHGPFEETLIRTLVAHRLARDGDAYTQALALGAEWMEWSVPHLESLVEPFFRAIVPSGPFAAEFQAMAAGPEPPPVAWAPPPPSWEAVRPAEAAAVHESSTAGGKEQPPWVQALLGAGMAPGKG
jgi:hypothetical protein